MKFWKAMFGKRRTDAGAVGAADPSIRLRRKVAELEKANLALRGRLAELAGADEFRSRYVGEAATGYEAKRSGSRRWSVENAFVERSLTGLAPGSRILDVPVGTGRFLPIYAERGFLAVGLDSSPDMLSQARSKAGRLGCACDLLEGDALALPFDASSFDAVVCVRLLNFFRAEQLERALDGLFRTSRSLVVLTLRTTSRSSVPLYAGDKHTIVHPLAAFDAYLARNGLSVAERHLVDEGATGQNHIYAIRKSR
jgi:ubiquinone/menaquinone biosynthesis C-methylase UbiE